MICNALQVISSFFFKAKLYWTIKYDPCWAGCSCSCSTYFFIVCYVCFYYSGSLVGYRIFFVLTLSLLQTYWLIFRTVGSWLSYLLLSPLELALSINMGKAAWFYFSTTWIWLVNTLRAGYKIRVKKIKPKSRTSLIAAEVYYNAINPISIEN